MAGRFTVNFVQYRPNHHSPHSGYDRITDYGSNYYDSNIIQAEPLPKRVIRNRIIFSIANGVISYDRKSLATELKTAWKILNSSNNIYHILYGENSYHYLGFINNFRNNRLVTTFHQPPDRIKQVVHIDWHIRQLSAVICVGRNQEEFFSNFLDPVQIFFVPHGIDIEYYTPPNSYEDRKHNLCLFVGQHLRDLPTLRGVIELVAFQRPETQFIAVTSPKAAELIGKHPNLTVLSGIPESDLLELYRSATLLVMPVHDATANNVLLESMACGLPIVTTDVGSTQDYVSPECAVLVPLQDSRFMADEVLNLLDSTQQRKLQSIQAREQALTFSWPKVTDQINQVFQSVI